VRLVSGCCIDPFQFVLRELRRRFPKDWDRSVDDREHIFRTDLIAAFSPFQRIVFFTDNITISTDIGDTDIDAVALDPLAGVAAISYSCNVSPECLEHLITFGHNHYSTYPRRGVCSL